MNSIKALPVPERKFDKNADGVFAELDRVRFAGQVMRYLFRKGDILVSRETRLKRANREP